MAERRARALELFQEAAGRHGPARDDYLAAACDGDAELRREVELLLAADERPGILDGSAAEIVVDLIPELVVVRHDQKRGSSVSGKILK